MRFVAVLLLWLVTTATLAVTVPVAWVQHNLVDADGYTALARRAADDPRLRSAVAGELATQAVRLIRARGHDDVDTAQVRAVAADYTGGPSFPSQFTEVNRVAHQWLFTGSGSESWVIDLAPMLNDSAFQRLLSGYNLKVPPTVTIPVTTSVPRALRPGQLQVLATWGTWITLGLAVFTGASAVLLLLMADRRGRALASVGVSALLVGAAGWSGIEVAHTRVDDALNRTAGDARRIADVMVAQTVDSLHLWLDVTLAAGGVLVVCGMVVAMLGSLLQRI